MAEGKRVIEIAAGHIGERYILGVHVPKDNQDWRGPWDCAEFASWCTFQAYGILFGCDSDNGDPAHADAYTGYWGRDAGKFAKKISVDQASQISGAMVLRIPQANLTGHIVMSCGDGSTIEAHSSKDGVIKGQLSGRRWDTGILIPGVDYLQGKEAPLVVPPKKVVRVTSPLTAGKKVVEIQKQLIKKGFSPGKPDGEYGSMTALAVAAFQLANGLVQDGEVGDLTAAALGIKL